MRKKIVIACPVATRSGYGAHSREICRAIISCEKYDVSIIPTRWGSTPVNALDDPCPENKLLTDRFIPGNLQYQPDIFIQITIPNEFQPIGKKNIGITAGIETTRCKPEWIEGCNKMDLVIATSNFTKQVFIDTQYEKRDKNTNKPIGKLAIVKPIIVLSEGIDINVYNAKNVLKSDLTLELNKIREEFCFLFVGHWLDGAIGHDRKDVSMLCKTFMESFANKAKHNRPALILKTSMAGFSIVEREKIKEKLHAIRNALHNIGLGKTIPNVYIIHGDLTDAEMNELYNHQKVKAMVSFHKGEGFGKPLLEFTTTGKPIIASAWSGPMDFLHPDYSIHLPGKLGQVHHSAVNDWIIADSQWFTVDYSAGGRAMRDVCDNYDDILEKSRKHKKYTIDNFTFDNMRNRLVEILDNIGDDIRDQPIENKFQLPKLKMKQEVKTMNLPKLTKI